MSHQIPIYIINLKRTPERKLFIQRQLDRLGLDYQFVDVEAIDKYKLESKAYRTQIADLLSLDASKVNRKYARIGSTSGKHKGQLAVLLSHIKVYNLMVENHHDTACILEDDATLSPNFPKILNTAHKYPWDVLQLAHQSTALDAFQQLLFQYHYHSGFLNFEFLRLFFRKSHDATNEIFIRKFGFDKPPYSGLSELMLERLQIFRGIYRDTMRPFLPEIIAAPFFPRIIMQYAANLHRYRYRKIILRQYHLLHIYALILFGMLPSQDGLKLITERHAIAQPKGLALSATAYLIKKRVVAKCIQKLLSDNDLVIDQIFYPLYKAGQLRLCIITPPCVVGAYHYLRYSCRTNIFCH